MTSKRIYISELHVPLIHFLIMISMFMPAICWEAQNNLISGRENACFSAMFSFGDSLTDTGNLLISNRAFASSIARLPYGETFFHKPTGRCSNGRLVVDFIGEAIGVGLLEPYLNKSGDFLNGVNFAVAGATALNQSYLSSCYNLSTPTPYSLAVQVEWFISYRRNFCSKYNGDCDEYFGNALFFFGEIGGNDFNFQFWKGRSVLEVEESLDPVMHEIKRALTRLVEEGGAIYIVVQNNLPIGCSPSYLAMYTEEQQARDAWGCMPELNQFATQGNDKLKEVVVEVQRQHPEVVIVTGDSYDAVMTLVRVPWLFGIEKTLDVCCGVAGARYDYDPKRRCASKESVVCGQPDTYLSWDGIHMTEAAYERMSWMMFLNGGVMSPPFHTLCPLRT